MDLGKMFENMVYGIVPPHILKSIAKNGSPEQQSAVVQTLELTKSLRAARSARMNVAFAAPLKMEGPNKNRRIYDAETSTDLPGKLVLSEEEDASEDVAVTEAFSGLGDTFDLFWEAFHRNSIDDAGMELIATVHYDEKYDNAFWNGEQMVFGDGDGSIFKGFTSSIDVIGHELTHGVTEYTARLLYSGQSGALNESVSDVFGSMIKQYALGQTADQADWLIGAELLADGIQGVALRSMKDPGTAYDDPILGKDPQPADMNHFVETDSDNGGVHINSGIPNRAFYLTAIALGGNSWEKAGQIWYQTLVDSRLADTAQFQEFADLTTSKAEELYGPAEADVVTNAWKEVGITISLPGALPESPVGQNA